MRQKKVVGENRKSRIFIVDRFLHRCHTIYLKNKDELRS